MIALKSGLEAVARGLVGGDEVITRVRDLLIVQNGTTSLVVACDSNASIGTKPQDALKQDPGETGYSASKVPLMEVIAIGATPFLLIDNLCVELEPYGRRILAGVERAAQASGYPVVVTGSDETNMPTVQTGIGVTVIGVVAEDGLRAGRARAGDIVFSVGEPRDGLKLPFTDGEPGIASAGDVRTAVACPYVSEVLPVGSKGIAYEANELARVAGLAFVADAFPAFDLAVSAGPSTCFLVAGSAEAQAWIAARTDCVVEPVGRLAPAA